MASIPIALFDIGATGTTMEEYFFNRPLGVPPLAPDSTLSLSGRAILGVAIASTFDTAGTLYLLMSPSGAIVKVAAGVQSTLVATSDIGQQGLTGIAVDPSGNIYTVTSFGNIQKFTSAGGGPTPFVTGINASNIVFNGAGNLIVLGTPISPTAIISVTLAGGQTVLTPDTTISSVNIGGIAFDSSQNIYVFYSLSLSTSAIAKFSSTGTLINLTLSSFLAAGDYPFAMTFEPGSGQLIVSLGSIASTLFGKAFIVSPTTGVQHPFTSTTLKQPSAIAGPLALPPAPPPPPVIYGTGPVVNQKTLPATQLSFITSKSGRDFICPRNS